MENPYATVFVPILAVLVLGVIGFPGVYTAGIFSTETAAPQVAAGAAQIVGASTPAEQTAAVTTEAVPLEPSEEARPLPAGLPQ